MTVKLGLLALLEAKPGKGAELGSFLEAGRALAAAESGTVTWYAFKISDTEYGIFDTFETEEARQAHLGGEIFTALGHVAGDLLAQGRVVRPDRERTGLVSDDDGGAKRRPRPGLQAFRVGALRGVDDLEGEQPPVELYLAELLEAFGPSGCLVAPGADWVEVKSHSVHHRLLLR